MQLHMMKHFVLSIRNNLEILKKLGAEIVTFSPIHDRSLPENIQGIVLYGGYPELYAKELSENDSMRESICHAVTLGVPCIAECGGFMYLQERLEGSDGEIYDMAGALFGKSYKTEKLRRVWIYYIIQRDSFWS